MESNKKKYFPSLTGLRAVAAYMVFLCHLPVGLGITKLFYIQREFHIGVPIFFVLSGFLIAARYFDSSLLSLKGFKTYLQNRFAGIYPLYFIILTIGLIISPLSWKVSFLNYSLLKAFFDHLKYTAIGPAWSLSVEETFYITAPFIFFCLKKYKSLLTLMICASCSIIIYLVFNYLVNFNSFLIGRNFFLSFTFFGRIFEFIVGILTYLYFKNCNRFKYSSQIGVIGIIAVIFILFSFGGDTYFDFGSDTIEGILLNNFILPFFIALLILGLITEKTWLSNTLSNSTFDLLGKSSYALYLLHLSFLYNLYFSFENTQTHFVVLYFLLIQLLSILAYKFIEHPLHNLLKSR